jgi:hypothetical protein
MIKNNFDGDPKLILRWETEDGIRCDIRQCYSLCGYATFPKRPVKQIGYGGILGDVDVHGGITYAEPVDENDPSGAYVYGFDTAHGWETDEHRTKEYIHVQIEKMIEGIQKAAKEEATE